MSSLLNWCLGFICGAGILLLSGCAGGTSGGHHPMPPPQGQAHLSVSLAGAGTVTSNPAGINCGQVCSVDFNDGTAVSLIPTPAMGSVFQGWSGACTGTSACAVMLSGTTIVIATFSGSMSPPPGQVQLSVSLAGSGTGTVTSRPVGINCGPTCSANFTSGSTVTLTATPATGSGFQGWSGGGCTVTSACSVTLASTTSIAATFGASLQSINHIIIMVQENRSFDHYFGAMHEYWANHGFPGQEFDGLPQFNLPAGPEPANPGCDPAFPPPSSCKVDTASPSVTSRHLLTMCVETPIPYWSPSHHDWNLANPVSPTPTLDGFVATAAQWARNQHLFDVNGIRAMGYYDGNDLNYYYWLASNFATSDRWFAPTMSRTNPNRMYLLAGTSHGHVYDLNQTHSSQLTDPIIFQLLQQSGINWKIYVHPGPNKATDPASLFQLSYINQFTYGNFILQKYPQNLVPISEDPTISRFSADLQNGTLPQVALIEPASEVGLDEHPSDTDTSAPPNIQAGAAYVESIINALMKSSSWKDSVFILTFDEMGGFYDHVPPQPAVSPDGIAPSDLSASDVCVGNTSAICDFKYTGYRVPLVVISPFTKKNYVSHTVADYTAILKLIETRFSLPSLTKRDAAQMDMTEFFDFTNAPWQTPPAPSAIPAQATNGPCYLDHLP